MANKKRLIDLIAECPDQKTVKRDWALIFCQQSPHKHAELIEVIKDFLAGGIVKQKFGSQRSLYRYLIANKCMPDVCVTSFNAFVLNVRDAP